MKKEELDIIIESIENEKNKKDKIMKILLALASGYKLEILQLLGPESNRLQKELLTGLISAANDIRLLMNRSGDSFLPLYDAFLDVLDIFETSEFLATGFLPDEFDIFCDYNLQFEQTKDILNEHRIAIIFEIIKGLRGSLYIPPGLARLLLRKGWRNIFSNSPDILEECERCRTYGILIILHKHRFIRYDKSESFLKLLDIADTIKEIPMSQSYILDIYASLLGYYPYAGIGLSETIPSDYSHYIDDKFEGLGDNKPRIQTLKTPSLWNQRLFLEIEHLWMEVINKKTPSGLTEEYLNSKANVYEALGILIAAGKLPGCEELFRERFGDKNYIFNVLDQENP